MEENLNLDIQQVEDEEHEEHEEQNSNFNNSNNNNQEDQDEQEYQEEEPKNEEEEMDEDEYLQALQLRLRGMKQERKEAEQNAKLLDNRLNMLKKEEDRQWKQIENKKRLASDKLMHVKPMAEMIQQKKNIEIRKEEEIQKKRKINQERKQILKDNLEAKKAEKQRQIQEEAKLLKIQKEYNRQLVEFLNREQLSNNKTKCDCIKSQYSIEKEKKMIIEQERKKRLREELEKKILEEYRLKEEAEEKKNRKEQEEINLVKRLQTTTQIQQNIAAEIEKINLENALKGNIPNNFMSDIQNMSSSSQRNNKY